LHLNHRAVGETVQVQSKFFRLSISKNNVSTKYAERKSANEIMAGRIRLPHKTYGESRQFDREDRDKHLISQKIWRKQELSAKADRMN
jgi:hypothetical protein